jgi:hypothetical protein
MSFSASEPKPSSTMGQKRYRSLMIEAATLRMGRVPAWFFDSRLS